MAYSETMAKGPKGEKRPADLNRRAFQIVRIASGEVEDKGKAERPATAGKAGGKARAERLTSAQRREIAKRGSSARWKKG
jgi:hypothetical protein